jgi:hypothetical protein
MKTLININHIRETEKYDMFPFVVEVAAWADTGETERWGTDSEDEARKILDDEIENTKSWAAKEIDDYDPDDEDNSIPEIAHVFVRPALDEDGDIPTLDFWKPYKPNPTTNHQPKP